MVNAHDVAAYILEKRGRMSAMKLQKLVYYAQAWALVWDDRPLFEEKVRAWANGPVVRDLYEEHRGAFWVGPDWTRGKSSALDAEQRKTVDAVLGFYGDKTPQWLSELTHSERPWAGARAGLAPGERGNSEITHAAMAEYYGSL